MVVRRLFYLVIIVGITVGIGLYINNFITPKVFIRCLLVYSGSFIIYALIGRIRGLNKVWPELVLILLLLPVTLFYVKYFYKVDLCVLVVPGDYTGSVILEMNDERSGNFVKPLDGVVVFETNSNGEFKTSSSFDIDFNRIIVTEKFEGIISKNSDLRLVNKDFIVQKTENRKHFTIKGTIVTAKH